MNNPYAEFQKKPQKMTINTSEAKGLKQVLKECGFEVYGMIAKCSPVCPFENNDCLLSKQNDFQLQVSLLEQKIIAKGHICTFLPKFHCELNPIEMVCLLFISLMSAKMSIYSTGICYARTLGMFLSALWRLDCLLYGYGIVRMRVAIPGTLRVSSCLYAYL